MVGMKNKKIYLAGHTGMVGSAIKRKYESEGFNNILVRSLEELDLTRQGDVEAFFATEKPDQVVIAAAKVGGILANNTYRAQFIYENLMIEANLIQAAYKHEVEKLLFLGSSCIYPKLAPQPLKEESLLTGSLEYTNEPYAIAKIAGIKMCESYYKQYGSNFISVMPTNLYGRNDNFNLETSHVLPALMRKFHEAKLNGEKKVVIWGTGSPKREFLLVDDLAEAIFFLMNNVQAGDLYDNNLTHLNIGSGEDLSILELANMIKKITGFEGEIECDPTKPDGTPRKLMDVSRINKLGWKHSVSLEEGIKKTYEWYLSTLDIK